MGNMYPVGMAQILSGKNRPMSGKMNNPANPTPTRTKEWALMLQVACWKKIAPGLSDGHSAEHTAITGNANASIPIRIRVGAEYFGLMKFICLYSS